MLDTVVTGQKIGIATRGEYLSPSDGYFVDRLDAEISRLKNRPDRLGREGAGILDVVHALLAEHGGDLAILQKRDRRVVARVDAQDPDSLASVFREQTGDACEPSVRFSAQIPANDEREQSRQEDARDEKPAP